MTLQKLPKVALSPSLVTYPFLFSIILLHKYNTLYVPREKCGKHVRISTYGD